jgi:hypothetical protein
MSVEDGHEHQVDIRRNKVSRERLIAHIEVSPDTKTGRR